MTLDRTLQHPDPLAIAPMPPLEWTTERLRGGVARVASWPHLDRLVEGLGEPDAPYLIVRRVDDPGHRFVQALGAPDRLDIEIGALDAVTGRHEVWRIRRGPMRFERVDGRANGASREQSASGGALTAVEFVRVAHDWLTAGVVPEFDSDRVERDDAF